MAKYAVESCEGFEGIILYGGSCVEGDDDWMAFDEGGYIL